jgi:hypothetical protein
MRCLLSTEPYDASELEDLLMGERWFRDLTNKDIRILRFSHFAMRGAVTTILHL